MHSHNNPSSLLSRRSFMALGLAATIGTAAHNILQPKYTLSPDDGSMGTHCSRETIRSIEKGEETGNVFTFGPEVGAAIIKRGFPHKDTANVHAAAFDPNINRPLYDKVAEVYRSKYNRDLLIAVAGAFVDPNGETEGTHVVEGKVYNNKNPQNYTGLFLVQGTQMQMQFPRDPNKPLAGIHVDENTYAMQFMVAVKDGKKQKINVVDSRYRFLVRFKSKKMGVITFKEPIPYDTACEILTGVCDVDTAFYLDCGQCESGAFWDKKNIKWALGKNLAGRHDNMLAFHDQRRK